MCSFIPAVPEYEGVPLDAFFFARDLVGLPVSVAPRDDDEQFLVFSLSELDTI